MTSAIPRGFILACEALRILAVAPSQSCKISGCFCQGWMPETPLSGNQSWRPLNPIQQLLNHQFYLIASFRQLPIPAHVTSSTNLRGHLAVSWMNYIAIAGAAAGSIAATAVVVAEGVGLSVGIAAAPIVGGVLVGGLAIGLLVKYFSRRPSGDNPTVRVIGAHHRLERLLVTIDERTNELEELRRANTEDALNRSRQEAMADERARERELRAEERAQERETLHFENLTLAEEAEERIAEREQELQAHIVEARQRLEEVQETIATGAQIQPIQWPTQPEFDAARELIQYSELNFHFAIVGSAGCGKSSLINAFLNLNPHQDGAAPTGVTETTLEIGRYPDPGTQAPRPWTVWFDIPGAGTQRVSHWQYFTNQALFVFDIIILAIGDRCGETDCQIIRSCIEFKIPFFVVRSKADQHIRNMVEDDVNYQGPFDSGELYRTCRLRFQNLSQTMVSDELERAGLPNQTVYCVSKQDLRDAYNGSLQQSLEPGDDSQELALVKQLMLAAWERRRGSEDTSIQDRTVGLAMAAYTAAAEFAGSRLGVTSTRNSQQRRVGNRQPLTREKRVIYLPRSTRLPELEIELDEKNPGLSATFVARPRMLGPTAAVLTFGPNATIPRSIVVFGNNQEPALYRERTNRTGQPSTAGSSVSTAVDTPPGSSVGTPPGSSVSRSAGGGRRRRRR